MTGENDSNDLQETNLKERNLGGGFTAASRAAILIKVRSP